MRIFFVRLCFGLFWCIIVKVVLIVCFWCLVCCVLFVYVCEGLFFLFLEGVVRLAKAFGGLGVTAGLAADRASMTGMGAGQQFFETDTNKTYVYNGSSWIQENDYTVGAMSVDSSGRLSLPYQPVASGSMDFGVGIWGPAFYIGNNLVINRGSHYNTSNGRFTCPVSGAYALFFQAIAWCSPGYGYVDIYKNGSFIMPFAHYNLSTLSGGNNWANVNLNAVINCSASDYLQFYIRTVSGNNGIYGASHNSFSIFYLG